ncbi:MAG: sigma-54-dependent Fis family transcriptional regulator [Mongoliibacter sp.]|uniref:sigma-54-dependent transcriptional regulator n=1 Tax=Mongoliibacter sp. TaxID=2022438 RepID=UPI0012EF6A73|nr:sigma-54 dependent transcriptional regulator [Mongoliibacter sp.]TVP53175.1 MAG: sigma-54-dependent Fis family transcriptional regulator [Mongoliibacter sp.]
MKSILIIDNHISVCDLLRKFLSKNNFNVETSSSASLGLDFLQRMKFDLILLEYHLPNISGLEFLERIKKLAPSTEVIFMSRDATLKNAVDVIHRGALNFISKPLNPDELLEIVNKVEPKSPNNVAFSTQYQPDSIVLEPWSKQGFIFGQSESAEKMMYQVKRVGATNYSVIIQGETGTGKESLARMIHEYSPRKNMPFIAVDCGCLSKEIGGSELFGHEKGAFTGAIFQKTGFFEQANGGTIFLDEISNLSLDIQMTLLRALQEKVIRKIGGNKEIPTDVRVITATNKNLIDTSENPFFREDLYFRLSEFILEVPALRERKKDLPLFVEFFLKQTSEELKIRIPKISEAVNSCFEQYTWPGNLRELRNVIRRSCLFLGKDNIIKRESLPERILQSILFAKRKTKPNNLHNGFETAYKEKDENDLKSTALKAESSRIIEVLNKVHFNKTKAAEILNIHRKTLYQKLKLMNIPN